MNIFEQATHDPISQAHWCREHGISYRTYRTMKQHYKGKGMLLIVPEPAAVFLEECNTCLTFRDTSREGLIHLYPKPMSGVGIETLLAMIQYEMGKDAYNGERYLFVSSDQKTLYSLKWIENGFCCTRTRKEKGRIAWPGGKAGFSEQDQTRLLQMLG